MSQKNISIIAAVANENAIGKDNKLLVHLPGDLKRFRNITTGHTVVMGRNTFFSLPSGPLKNRRNIVITDNPGDDFPGCEIALSVKEAIEKCDAGDENFVIGGASVYRQFMPFATRLYITRIYKTFEADTWFPDINPDEWHVISYEPAPTGPDDDFITEYITYQRKR